MTPTLCRPKDVEVIAPNFKRRLSGVTATIVRLLPLQARDIGIAAVGPGLPDHVPHMSLWQLLVLDRKRRRVWHARRNSEMLTGLALRSLLRKRFKLLFTSASQRTHTGYTKWLIGRMDRIVATSRKTAEYLDRPADVVLHGIDPDRFAPTDDKAGLRRALGLPAQGMLVGCYGRIRHQKGTDLFVDAMMDILAGHDDTTALVMGRATSEHETFLARLQARVAEAGLSDRILFLPEVGVHDMADWYRVLDLYVAPQRWEGFGLTPLEAMACAVPVVATDVGAFSELVVPGRTGEIIAADDVGAMSAAIRGYLEGAPGTRDHGQAARQHVLDRFRLTQEAERLIAIYRELLAEVS